MNKAILCVIPVLLIGVAAGQEQRAEAGRLYFDRSHGEFPPHDPLAGIARKLNLELVSVEEPVSAATLQGSRLLYLRAPSKTFRNAEKDAIVAFVKGGGSLLLVLDIELSDTESVERTKGARDWASSGIGKAVAIALGEAGADVAVNFVQGGEAANGVVAAITANGSKAIAVQADVSQEEQVQAMFRRTIEEFGTIDILVNNAGVQTDASIEDMTLAEWNAVIGINLTGQFLCAREAIREFRRRGVIKGGLGSCGQRSSA